MNAMPIDAWQCKPNVMYAIEIGQCNFAMNDYDGALLCDCFVFVKKKHLIYSQTASNLERSFHRQDQKFLALCQSWLLIRVWTMKTQLRWYFHTGSIFLCCACNLQAQNFMQCIFGHYLIKIFYLSKMSCVILCYPDSRIKLFL